MIGPFIDEQCAAARSVFTSPDLRFVMDAVAAGNSPATAWLDRSDDPRAVFLWDRAHCFYLGGSPDEDFLQQLGDFIADDLLPNSRSRNHGTLKIEYDQPELEAAVARLFRTAAPNKYPRSHFVLDPALVAPSARPIPDGCRIVPIDRDLLTSGGLRNADAVRYEIESCWPSLERFLEHGFGFCLRREDELVCWCTAEYVSEGVCGIGIETDERFQGQGYATLTAAAFVDRCLRNGIVAHWDSWVRNAPSVAVARKVGFRKLLDYEVYFSLGSRD